MQVDNKKKKKKREKGERDKCNNKLSNGRHKQCSVTNYPKVIQKFTDHNIDSGQFCLDLKTAIASSELASH